MLVSMIKRRKLISKYLSLIKEILSASKNYMT